VSDDGLDGGLVDDGQEPTVDVDERLAETGIQDELVETEQGGGDDNVGQSDALTDQEGASLEVLVQDVKRLADVALGALSGGGIVGDLALDREHPHGGWELNLVCAEINPLLNLTCLEGAGTVQVVLGEAGNVGAMALLSKRVPSGVSTMGTFPAGLFFKNSASIPVSLLNSGTSTSTPAYLAVMRIFHNKVLFLSEYTFKGAIEH